MTKLFSPLTIKDVTLRNRIAVSPMCQYSSDNGYPNDWHLVHLGSRAVGGAGLIIVEATAVSPEGRISPGDSGLYLDGQVEPFARITSFLKQHGSVAGIQIAHAGRKASAAPPWDGGRHLANNQGGWDTIAPSPLAFGGDLDKVPNAMTVAEIERVKSDFVKAAQRSLDAGFEWLEVHFAHGYLGHEFYSPLSNQRDDQYGGSYDNRIRFLMETFSAVRDVWPERLPLSVRLSVTDWCPGGVTIEESIELTRRLKEAGLDMLDVSHGMNTPSMPDAPIGAGFMLPYAAHIRREADIQTATSWMITEPVQAETALHNEQLDLVMLGRELLRDPYWPYHAAQKLGFEQASDLLPVQYARAVNG